MEAILRSYATDIGKAKTLLGHKPKYTPKRLFKQRLSGFRARI